MDLELRDRVAIVAASSDGLGKAIARELAAEGARVTINGRDRARLDRTAEDIRSLTGAEILAIDADVTRDADVRRLVDESKAHWGKIDILVTNSAGPPAGTFSGFEENDYRRAVELNLISTIALCRAAVPHMKATGWGRIVAVNSIAAKQPIDRLILSNTVRAGVLGFMKSLADELAPFGITVNTLCPGLHLTRRLDELFSSTAKDQGLSTEEVKRRSAESISRLGES